MRQPIPTQAARILWLLVYSTALLSANYLVTGALLPPTGDDGLWFYAAVVSILLGDLVVNPYYVAPKDSLAAAVPVAIALWLALPEDNGAIRLAAQTSLYFCLGVVILALATMLTTKWASDRSAAVNRWLKEATVTIGHPKVALSLLFIVAIALNHLDSTAETLLVGGSWAVLIGVQPERPLYWMWRRLRTGPAAPRDIGAVVGYQMPDLLLVRNESDANIGFGSLIVCKDARGPGRLSMVLDCVGRDEALLLRCLELAIPIASRPMLDQLAAALGPDRAGEVAFEALQESPSDLRTAQLRDNLIGIVDEHTDIEKLYFEVIRDLDIEEGQLVETLIRGEKILYQIVNGLTKEEVAHQRHTYGYARADAAKVGKWDAAEHRFLPGKWLPSLNTPVLKVRPMEITDSISTVGHFPGSSYPIGIKNVHELVTHNTAILGILGIGKSMLAVELVERMLAEGIKVVCLDLTNQYAAELHDWHDSDAESASTDVIVAAGKEDKNQFADSPEDGGSFPRLKHAIAVDLRRFLKSEGRLKIYNPARFAATRQDNEPRTYKDDQGNWQRNAPLWSVTPVQVTQVVAETLLYLLQDEMTDRARVCLVLEEAHSLVPEFSNITNDVDRNATNGTARAILQGRKYGFGCVLVTQRTANVTKTILNQCNTVFAMRTYDDTGKAFLSNYLGSRYADVLSTLGEREAVFFGKASTCDNPVRVRLNDRSAFLSRFRAVYPPPAPVAPVSTEPALADHG